MQVNYTPPPTAAKFMNSASFGRMLLGPVGSGKTTACMFELFRRACEQAPAQDGLRYTRFAIVRQTLSQLKETVLKEILTWLRPICEYKVSASTIFIDAGDIRSEFILIPLDDTEDQRRLLSSQFTMAWMNEFTEMDIGLVAPLSGRVGRYPSAAQGGCTFFGVIGDSNMPAEGSDWHKFLALETPPDFQIFFQPSGMSPEAENLAWLMQTEETLKLAEDDPIRLAQGRSYYERFIRSNSEGWCRRYVHAEFGDDPSGSAVFRESFRSNFHVVDSLEPVLGHPLLIGQDFGRDPWSIICQVDHRGRLLVLEECEAEDIGLELHLQRTLRPRLMQMRYLNRKVAVIGDPAGRSKDTLYEETSFDLLKKNGFACFPAPSNDIDPRIRAVESFLLSQRDGGPAIVFDKSRCPTLVRAMGGGYRYAKMRSGQRKPTPEKGPDPYSHVSDALQYVCMAANWGLQGSMLPMINRHMTANAPREAMGSAGWT